MSVAMSQVMKLAFSLNIIKFLIGWISTIIILTSDLAERFKKTEGMCKYLFLLFISAIISLYSTFENDIFKDYCRVIVVNCLCNFSYTL